MGHIDELCLGIKNFKKLFETFFMDTSTVKASDHLPPFPELSNIRKIWRNRVVKIAEKLSFRDGRNLPNLKWT